ncbi:MAG: hypothetical protein LAO18_22220 [Acidobacteriia bacterium]|nr:hypothetical protein [Terriglobia bacterium]
MSTPNFGSVLDVPASEIKAPVALPAGPYLCVVQGLPKQDVSSKKKTEYLEYTLTPLQVMEEEMEAGVAELGGLTDKTIRATFYLSEKSVYRLKEFIEHCGVEIAEGEGLRGPSEAVVGCQVIAFLKHESSEDGKKIYAKFSGSAPVDGFGE